MADTVARAVVALAEAFGRKASETTVETYRIGLRGLSDAEIEAATAAALQECEFMPPPAVLRRLAGSGKASTLDLAISAWGDVERAFPVGAYKWVDFDDPIINAVIRHLGGWVAMFDQCGTSEKEKWYRHEFVKVYQSFAANGISEEACRPLQGINQGERVRLVNGKVMIQEPTPKRIPCDQKRWKERERWQPKLIDARQALEAPLRKPPAESNYTEPSRALQSHSDQK